MHSFKVASFDHVYVHAYSWLPDIQPVAALQIVHGMQEHARRYDHFASWLNSKGIAVYSNDHIGHGLSANYEAEISHFPRKDDWQRSVDILRTITKKIRTEHPGIPVFILGHSMGSVMTQTYMAHHGYEADAYILSGAIRQPLMIARIGQLIAGSLSGLFGPGDRSKITIALGYGQYNRQFRPNRTTADWLCSDNSAVDEYIASPLCGVPLSNRFYYNLCYGFQYIANPKNLSKIPAGKSVYIIAGEKDPAGFNGEAPRKVKKLLSRYGRAKVDLKLYPGCRHEILNETIKEEVYQDVYNWMNKYISR